LIFKCIECGNTFKVEKLNDEKSVTCPVCEANYVVETENGKPTLKEAIYENEDLGEL
jgi:hypothetical protein